MIERFAVAQTSTSQLTFDQDLEVYVDAGIGGVGIAEVKLGPESDGKALEKFLWSGLRANLAIPEV